MQLEMKNLDSVLVDLSIFVERALVLIDDVSQGYFEEPIQSREDLWRIAEPYRTHARVKTQIAYSILCDTQKKVQVCQAIISKHERDLKNKGICSGESKCVPEITETFVDEDEYMIENRREEKIEELMEEFNSDHDVAEAMLDLMIEDGELDPAEYCMEGILGI